MGSKVPSLTRRNSVFQNGGYSLTIRLRLLEITFAYMVADCALRDEPRLIFTTVLMMCRRRAFLDWKGVALKTAKR